MQVALQSALHAEMELDDATTRPGKASKQRGVADADLARRLRRELDAMLAEPLRQRVNARFFTGGTSQLVAASLVADERAKGTAGGTEGAAVAMQDSIALAESVVAKRGASTSAAAGAGVGGKRKRKAPSLAQCREQALQRALQAKQRKKAGAQGAVRSAKLAMSARSTTGAEALAQLRAV